MKIFIIQLIVFFRIVATVRGLYTTYYDLNKAPLMFMIFTKDYNKVYKDIADLVTHYDVFKNNLEYINEHNRLHKGISKIYVDQYTDMNSDEMLSTQEDQV